MRVEVSVGGVNDLEREGELRSLHDWLRSDRRVRLLAAPRLEASTASVPGAQGSVIDVLSLVLGSAFSAASLAVSVMNWRATRRQRPPTLTVQCPDGTVIEINTDSPDEAQQLLERLGAE